MNNHDPRLQLLSKYQRRALREYQRILEATSLNPDRILEFAEYDSAAVMPVIRSMTDQIVRSEVIYDYTMIDMELDHLFFQHFFGTGEKLRVAACTRRYRTLQLMLQSLYLLQKLTIVKTFKHIPKKSQGRLLL